MKACKRFEKVNLQSASEVLKFLEEGLVGAGKPISKQQEREADDRLRILFDQLRARKLQLSRFRSMMGEMTHVLQRSTLPLDDLFGCCNSAFAYFLAQIEEKKQAKVLGSSEPTEANSLGLGQKKRERKQEWRKKRDVSDCDSGENAREAKQEEELQEEKEELIELGLAEDFVSSPEPELSPWNN